MATLSPLLLLLLCCPVLCASHLHIACMQLLHLPVLYTSMLLCMAISLAPTSRLANEPDKRQTEGPPRPAGHLAGRYRRAKRHTHFWPLLIMTKTVCSRTPTKAQAEALSIVHSHALSCSLSVFLARSLAGLCVRSMSFRSFCPLLQTASLRPPNHLTHALFTPSLSSLLIAHFGSCMYRLCT